MIDKKLVYGVTFVALIAAVMIGTLAVYNGALRQSTPLIVETSRAGLTLAEGAPVKMRGVQIGRVGSVRSMGDGSAVLDLEINEDQFGVIGDDVTAQIVPPRRSAASTSRSRRAIVRPSRSRRARRSAPTPSRSRSTPPS